MENIGMAAQGFVIWDTKQGRIVCGYMSSGFYMYSRVDLPGWLTRDQGRIVRINLVSVMAKGGEVKTPVVQIDYNTLTPEDVIQGALGFTESNLWLTWMAQTARESAMSNCIACAAARPTLVIVPAPIYENADPLGLNA
ncbi:hypothetical protein GOODEAATRI_034086 [Goodea atripinnis]|uniref:Uncharacterized protein n=1 Tax=Goodea atripinnis TaxID=208336 RepID=A0ABV0Q427_9TELE